MGRLENFEKYMNAIVEGKEKVEFPLRVGSDLLDTRKAENGMTNEEAKDLLDNLIGAMEDNHGNDYDAALKMGIKAIGTLEKIREEVCKLYPCYRIDRDYPGGVYDGKCWVLDKVVDIIDKYKSESGE